MKIQVEFFRVVTPSSSPCVTTQNTSTWFLTIYEPGTSGFETDGMSGLQALKNESRRRQTPVACNSVGYTKLTVLLDHPATRKLGLTEGRNEGNQTLRLPICRAVRRCDARKEKNSHAC